QGDPVMRSLRIHLFAVLATALIGCGSASKHEAHSPEPERDAAVPDATEPDAKVPDAPEPDAAGHDEPEPTGGSVVLTFAKDKLPILQGTRAKLVVAIERKNGFDEAIRISAAGLPEGVSMAEVSVAKRANEATLVFETSASTPHSLPTEVTIKAS